MTLEDAARLEGTLCNLYKTYSVAALEMTLAVVENEREVIDMKLRLVKSYLRMHEDAGRK